MQQSMTFWMKLINFYEHYQMNSGLRLIHEQFAAVVRQTESLRARAGESARHPGKTRRGRWVGVVSIATHIVFW
jgi:hypothetical protein